MSDEPSDPREMRATLQKSLNNSIALAAKIDQHAGWLQKCLAEFSGEVAERPEECISEMKDVLLSNYTERRLLTAHELNRMLDICNFASWANLIVASHEAETRANENIRQCRGMINTIDRHFGDHEDHPTD